MYVCISVVALITFKSQFHALHFFISVFFVVFFLISSQVCRSQVLVYILNIAYIVVLSVHSIVVSTITLIHLLDIVNVGCGLLLRSAISQNSSHGNLEGHVVFLVPHILFCCIFQCWRVFFVQMFLDIIWHCLKPQHGHNSCHLLRAVLCISCTQSMSIYIDWFGSIIKFHACIFLRIVFTWSYTFW